MRPVNVLSALLATVGALLGLLSIALGGASRSLAITAALLILAAVLIAGWGPPTDPPLFDDPDA